MQLNQYSHCNGLAAVAVVAVVGELAAGPTAVVVVEDTVEWFVDLVAVGDASEDSGEPEPELAVAHIPAVVAELGILHDKQDSEQPLDSWLAGLVELEPVGIAAVVVQFYQTGPVAVVELVELVVVSSG